MSCVFSLSDSGGRNSALAKNKVNFFIISKLKTLQEAFSGHKKHLFIFQKVKFQVFMPLVLGIDINITFFRGNRNIRCMRAILQSTQVETTSCRRCIVTIMLFCIILFTSLSIAQASAKNTTPASAVTNDVRILIDISGSMKKNDPANLRQPALNLLISLLPEDMQSGVWTFGQWVNMLIPHGTVTKLWKNNAKESVQKINSAGLYTNIEDAIRRSTWDWRKMETTPNSKRSLILLTDGLVDISTDEKQNQISRKHILQELLPALQKAGITIHAIALSNDSDKNLLEQLSTATGGRFEVIETTKGLERLFLHMFENVAPTDSLPLTENRVKVDSSIKEMTFLMFREDDKKEGSVISPSGKKYTIDNQQPAMSWHKELHYDLVTVQQPETGYWKIGTNIDPDNRVMIVTDLKLRTSDLPGILYAGDEQKLHVQLEDNGSIIDNQDFLHFVKIKYIQESLDENNNDKKWTLKVSDNGKGIDTKAKDGIYSIRLKKSLIAGEHEIGVEVNGTTFKRQYRKQIIIYDEPVTASIELTPNGALKVNVLPYQALVDADSLKITASHKLPNRKSNKANMERLSPAEWSHEFSTEGLKGKHKVTIKVNGKKNDGKSIKVTLKPLYFTVKDEPLPLTEGKNKPTEIPVDHEEDAGSENESFSWAMVSLKIGSFNIIILALLFSLYKYLPKIKQKMTPPLFEEATDG